MLRVRFSFLCSLHDILDDQLAAGTLDLTTYTAECERMFAAAGWTSAEFLHEIDRGWDSEVTVRTFEAKQLS